MFSAMFSRICELVFPIMAGFMGGEEGEAEVRGGVCWQQVLGGVACKYLECTISAAIS